MIQAGAWLSGLSVSGRMEETNYRALQLLDQLMDRPGVNIEAFKRAADICDEEEEYHERASSGFLQWNLDVFCYLLRNTVTFRPLVIE